MDLVSNDDPHERDVVVLPIDDVTHRESYAGGELRGRHGAVPATP
jgi:hypothetical protein